MLKLHGFLGSSYYNMVKLGLLEKRLPFEEVSLTLGASGRLEHEEGYLGMSPMGKVPCLETEQGFLSETNVILDYLEERGEGPSFYPADAFARAKVRELMKCLELYIELPARRLYGEFFERPASDEEKGLVKGLLEDGFAALVRLGHFTPYLAGEEITYADFYGLYSLTSATRTAKAIYGWDAFNTVPGVRDLLTRVGQRPTAQRIKAEQQR